MTTDDELFARLRAADPAAGTASDLDALRRAVDLRIGEPAAASPDPPGGDARARDETDARDELAARRDRRRRRTAWLSGAAAALVVGLAGYALGSSGTNQVDSGSAGGAAEDREQYAQESAGEGDQDSPVTMSGADAGGGVAAEEDDGTGERVVFEASGLPTTTGTAEAFGYDPSAVDGREAAIELAAALGVDDTSSTGGQVWMLSGDDGRMVEVYEDGVMTAAYTDPSVDLAQPPDDAVGVASEFLRTIGLDPADYRLSEDGVDVAAVQVAAYPDDVDVPAWVVTVAGDEVAYANGALAPLVSWGEYGTISATDAVARLMDPRFGPGGGEIGDDGTMASDGAAAPPGSAIPWPVETVTIDSAELGSAPYGLDDGSTLVLPTWTLTSTATGQSWTVVAVVDSELDLDAR